MISTTENTRETLGGVAIVVGWAEVPIHGVLFKALTTLKFACYEIPARVCVVSSLTRHGLSMQGWLERRNACGV